MIRRLSLQILILNLTVLSLLACGPGAVTNEEPGADNRRKLENSSLQISQPGQSPRFNVVNYSQVKNPHKVVEKDFAVTALSTLIYRMDQHSFTTSTCSGDPADFEIYRVSDGEAFRILNRDPFEARPADSIKVILNNPGSCQNLDYRFSIILAN